MGKGAGRDHNIPGAQRVVAIAQLESSFCLRESLYLDCSPHGKLEGAKKVQRDRSSQHCGVLARAVVVQLRDRCTGAE